jgi:hypothetical protein
MIEIIKLFGRFFTTVSVAFSKRIAMECLYSNCSAKESASYLKQYAVDCSDWVLLENP